MSIDIEAKLIVGLEFEELKGWLISKFGEDVLEQDFYSLLNSVELTYASVTYDAPPEEWIIGLDVTPNFGSYVYPNNLVVDISSAYDYFKVLTGLDARIYCTNDIS